MVPARDHKRVGEGETGPNTGGIGAYAPSHLADDLGIDRLSELVVDPIANALADLGVPYQGILYAGLILTTTGPKVIEFNCRFGDPEAQVVLPLLETDLAEVAFATATGQLPDVPLRFRPGYRCGVVLTAEGYPGPPSTGQRIDGISDVDQAALVFHGGTTRDGDRLVTSGGRVLTVVGTGPTLADARSHAYGNARRIRFEGVQYRRDIGLREA
jgi:phosphoribosylamine---glycine ligase